MPRDLTLVDVPSDLGSEPLLNPKHEKFCWTFIRVMDAGKAWVQVFSGSDERLAKQRGKKLVKRTEVSARIRYLLKQESADELTRSQINKQQIELNLWQVASRCMQKEKAPIPKQLRGRQAKLCAECDGKTPANWCEACEWNQKLFRDFSELAFNYRFDAKGAISALVPLGKERGMFADRKLVGNLEGDELIDSMTDEEVKGLVRTLAGEVGLRVVEAGGESPAGAEAESGQDVQPVPEAGGVSPTRH